MELILKTGGTTLIDIIIFKGYFFARFANKSFRTFVLDAPNDTEVRPLVSSNWMRYIPRWWLYMID